MRPHHLLKPHRYPTATVAARSGRTIDHCSATIPPGALVPSELLPLATALRGYRTLQAALPGGIRLPAIRSAIVFGSSLRRQRYRDVDLALFLAPQHPIFRTNDAPVLLHHAQIGRLDYSVIADTRLNRELFDDFAQGTYRGRGYLWKQVNLLALHHLAWATLP